MLASPSRYARRVADLPMPPAALPPGWAPAAPRVPGPPRAGRLTPAWRLVFGLAWAMAVLAYVAVWTSSRTMGLGTWWLGSVSDPQPLPVRLVPFVPCFVALAAAARNTAATAPIGIAAAIGLVAVGAGDLTTYPRYAAVELAIAGATAAVGIAALGGRTRPGPASVTNATAGR